MSTKLLRQIKNSLPDLRKSEKVVGEFVLKDPKSIITMKTAEASDAMGISEPTLIRFCKAIGFTGFQEFKINLSQQLAADDYFVMYEIKEDDSILERISFADLFVNVTAIIEDGLRPSASTSHAIL